MSKESPGGKMKDWSIPIVIGLIVIVFLTLLFGLAINYYKKDIENVRMEEQLKYYKTLTPQCPSESSIKFM
jgi:predicted RND superfamily exporter protein